LDDVLDEFIAAFDCLAQVTAAQVFQFRSEHFGQERFLAFLDGFLDLAENGRATGQRFKATFVAATALRSAYFQHHVSNFTRRAIETRVQLAFQNEPAADACAEENTDDVARFGFQLHFVNSERADIAVVFQKDRPFEQFLQFFLERHIVPAKIRRENDFPGFRIHGSGRADADGLDLLQVEVAFVHRLADATGDAPDHLVGSAVGFGADPRASNALKFCVEHARQDFGAAKIDANYAVFFVILSGHGEWLIELSLWKTHLPTRTPSIISCNSALISSADRSPLTMVNP